ncbi:hypothetical protein MBRA1_002982 [Malassezia brasiliensis]|uniref:Uncharacterized protein n=1 Tax=Malassezia brasiliensis TaxID=1821822 RepID=A0AAF0DZD0_9BASI|nr:hypothetical protein MBRA1_002982 [Malassezia brasiliensis]
MVRLPRGVEQLVTAYLTGALVQRLSRSPTVLRATERILHEWDTLPQRLAGRPVPYTPRDYGQPEGRVSDIDHGEPHDEPSPFPMSGKYSGDAARMQRGNSTSRGNVGQDDARDDALRRTRARPARNPHDAERDAVAREIRALQDKLRRGE